MGSQATGLEVCAQLDEKHNVGALSSLNRVLGFRIIIIV